MMEMSNSVTFALIFCIKNIICLYILWCLCNIKPQYLYVKPVHRCIAGDVLNSFKWFPWLHGGEFPRWSIVCIWELDNLYWCSIIGTAILSEVSFSTQSPTNVLNASIFC